MGAVVRTFFGDWGAPAAPAGAAPAPAGPAVTPFVPTFEDVTESGPYNSTWKLNPFQFATIETATYLMLRFGAVAIVSTPFSSPPYTINQPELSLLFRDGTLVNAGMLASYFARGPEDKFPGWAETFVLQAISTAQAVHAAEVKAQQTK